MIVLRFLLGLALVASLASACHGEPEGTMPASSDGPSPEVEAGPSLSGPFDAGTAPSEVAIPEQRRSLCARPANDAVRDIFCLGAPTNVSSLRELLARLQIETLPVDMEEAAAAAIRVPDDRAVSHAVLLGHSTALSGQLVSSINPRAILLNGTTLVAFQRGVQKVEIATTDRTTGRRNFYLVTFKQPCNVRSGGCLPGDLYTLEIERNWLEVTLEDDEDLKNTPRDCRMCHQRRREAPILLMRELLGPWPHFFFADREADPYQEGVGPSGRALVRSYRAAKGDESYAGIPPAALRQTAGVTLQLAVRAMSQPLQFDPTIELQAARSGPEATGRSAIWDQRFAAFKRGEHLPLPYFRADASDPRKRAALSAAYGRYRMGELPREALPDLSDIYPDDPQTRAEIGLQTEPAASPAETLVQACGSCHNDVLDQTISRARFNIDLARMSASELELAITRITLPDSSEEVMPPKGTRQLDAAGRLRLLEYLRQAQRDSADDALLKSAAQKGMAIDVSYLGS